MELVDSIHCKLSCIACTTRVLESQPVELVSQQRGNMLIARLAVQNPRRRSILKIHRYSNPPLISQMN